MYEEGSLEEELFQTSPHENGQSLDKPSIDTFYTFRSASSYTSCRGIFDSGACSTVDGKQTLDDVIEKVDEASPKLPYHRFGNYDGDQRSLFAVFFSFGLP